MYNNKIISSVVTDILIDNSSVKGTDESITSSPNCPHLPKFLKKGYIMITAASRSSNGIGISNDLPWSIPGDMKYFKDVTIDRLNSENCRNAVIMGRKTWESIPEKFRPLPDRYNVVLSRGFTKEKNEHNKKNYPSCVILASSLEDANFQMSGLEDPKCGKRFIIGGGEIYKTALESQEVDSILLTSVYGSEEGKNVMKFDTFFPKIDENEWRCDDLTPNGVEMKDFETGYTYRFLKYDNVLRLGGVSVKTPDFPISMDINPSEEMQYLDLCQNVINNGVKRMDRTGVGTLSNFCVQMRFSLRNNILPLLTTKRVFWRGVAEELLWFIKGSTNANELTEKGIHVWDGNGSREFLDNRGLPERDVGDLGPVYGFQWRHFGANYTDMHADYKGQGVDQLAECINSIKNNPCDRRIIMSAWNPTDLKLMALPPCHMFCQFFVDTEKGELSCQMYQRSADLGLGVPFNIASYALLTHMMAQVCGLKAGDFIHVIGDAHVYLNHVDAIKEQLTRNPRPFPTLEINKNKSCIDDFVYDDFTIEGYIPHKSIKMDMAI
jgi:dihydrofolate reductase/thymidylate synthase